MTGIVEDNILLKREWGTIKYAVRRSGRMPARKFVESLDVRARIKLEALLERMAEYGEIRNVEKFKHLQDKIYEFKSGKNRVLCFQGGRSWILTNGFKKQKGKTPRGEIMRAQDIMKEHLGR